MASVCASVSSVRLCSKCGKKTPATWTVSPCGHEFCRPCIQLGGSESCFECHAAVECIACPGKRHGCKFDTTKGLWTDHVPKCVFFPLQCMHRCGMIVTRNQMPTHLASDCQLRLIPCQFCQEGTFQVEVQDHEGSCPKAPTSCPYCLREGLKREEMEQHAKNCSETPKPCPLVEFGCKFSGVDKDVDQHLTVRNHVDCFREMKKSQQERQQEVNNLRSELVACRMELDSCKNELAEMAHGGGAMPFGKEIRWVFQAPTANFGSLLSPLYRHRETGSTVYFQLKKRDASFPNTNRDGSRLPLTLCRYQIRTGKATEIQAVSTVVLYLLEQEMTQMCEDFALGRYRSVGTSVIKADKEIERKCGISPDEEVLLNTTVVAGKQYLIHFEQEN